MRMFPVAILTSLLFLVGGCQTKGEHDHEETGHDHAKADHSHDKADAPKAAAVDAKSDCGCGKEEKADCAQAQAGQDKSPCAHADEVATDDHDAHADHADDDHSKDPIAAGEGAVNPHGPLDEKLGQALAGTESVDVAELVSDPGAYDGKTVTLTGEVTDMCHHRRGWFAVASKDGKKMVRVITGPGKFLVPQAAIGATAKAEGAVKVITLDEKQIAYYRRSHKFISDEELRAGGPIKQAILMATGAEFKR